MKNLINKSLLLLITLTSTAWSTVREIRKYSEVTQQLGQAQLVVFDIDNTILHPTQTLGSDQWFDDRVKRHLNEGMDLNVAVDAAIKEWVSVQKVTGVKLTDKELPGIFAYLKQMGIPVMGLTARPLELIETSVRQLASAGISFANNTVNAFVTDFDGNGQSLFRNGVLFVGPKNNKGILLKQFLTANHLNPQTLYFFDDKVKHVNNVEKEFAGGRIQYTGFRYGAMDAWVASFNSENADAAWQYFHSSGTIVPEENSGGATCEQSLANPFDFQI